MKKCFLNSLREMGWNNLIIWLVEAISLLLAIFNILPREIILFSTGLMIFYFIFAPLEDAIWLFVASIPLFAALPITESFDSMANWRILLVVLFLTLFARVGISFKLIKNKIGRWIIKENVKHYLVEYLAGIFLVITCLSLFVASDVTAGIKKIIFIINVFLLFIIIRNFAARNYEFVFKLIGAIKVAIGTFFIVGFIQLIVVFIIPLNTFWHFWANRVIPVFYGQALVTLVSHSNTWFSYYAYQAPTLRMFSVFPDSHSFAFFCILALPLFLTAIFLNSSKDKKKSSILYCLLILCLLSILFSGSRGAWASSLGVFVLFLCFIFLSYSPSLRQKKFFFITEFTRTDNWWKFFQLSLGCVILLVLLLPVSSQILFLPQGMQANGTIDKISAFERAKSIIDFSEISVKSRLQIWQKSINSIMKNPILGVGIGNYPTVLNEDISFAKRGSSAHNLYLDIASEMGIFALLVLLVIFWQIFKDTWDVFNHHWDPILKYWAGFFTLALIWILGYSLFDVVLLNDKVFLFFMANLGIIYVAKSSISGNKHSNL